MKNVLVPGKVEVKAAIAPQNSDGTLINGNIFDGSNYNSAIVALTIGAVTGTPTNLQAEVTVYSGNEVDNETTPTSITDEVASTVYLIDVDGLQAGNAVETLEIINDDLGKWQRVAVDLTFTGGSTPAADIACEWILGDPIYSEEVPAAVNVLEED